MKLWEIFRFEIGYQARRVWTWLYFIALLAITFQVTMEAYTGDARDEGYFFNGPFVIVSMVVLAGVMSLVITAALAGDAGARDAQTRMHPLVYTTPIHKATFLGGRFLAAFALNAFMLGAAQIALLVSGFMPGIPAANTGPFQPLAYIGAYVLISLPTAFVSTAILFSLAVLSRRSVASYLGAVMLFFISMFVYFFLAGALGKWDLAAFIDPLAVSPVSEVSRRTTAAQKNMLDVVLNASFVWNRLVWLAVAVVVLLLTYARFRFAHPGARAWLRRTALSKDAEAHAPLRPITVPRVTRKFNFTTRLHQIAAVTVQSFRDVALSWGGLILVALGIVLVITGPSVLSHLGVPLLPTTQQMTSFVGNTGEILWTIIPMLTVFYVGELVWRDRETGLSEISDAAPVTQWVQFIGRFTGLTLLFVGYQLILMIGCMLIQMQLGYYDFELWLYFIILFGLQLSSHILFAVVAFAVHVLVNHKYAGHMIALMALAFTAFGSSLGLEHKLLVYNSAPEWNYSEMRGFGGSLAPFMWFKLYWAAWALLLAAVVNLFWVSGREGGLSARLRSARQRLSGSAIGALATAVALIITLGGFVYYNTTRLNEFRTTSVNAERRVEYERRYARYANAAIPQLRGADLRIDIHPDKGAADLRATYRLANMGTEPIDSIHVSTDWYVETSALQFDRPAALTLDDAEYGHRVYVLQEPLMPGDSMRADFTVRFDTPGFGNNGVDQSVTGDASFFEPNDWLPRFGYQSGRELSNAAERTAYALPPRRAVRALDDLAARSDLRGAELITLNTVVSTAAPQIAVAPGSLRRSWTERGRRYFEYVTDVPIRNDYAIFSAAYAVHQARWNDVAIEIVHHPRHASNVARMAKSAQASLEYFSQRFGPYPYRQLRLIEYPTDGNSLHAYPINVSYQEGFSLFNPEADPRDIDFAFAVVAHEMAHQWWGNQLQPANVEGGPLLSESLAWYSAFLVVQQAYGTEHMERLLTMMREGYETPRSRGAVPLLRAYDRFTAYRKGPFALYALREYLGEKPVETALQRLLAKHGAGKTPLPTSLDLYRELQAVTPDSLRYLLVDWFEVNTFWELKTRKATFEKAADAWRVTLDVEARKVAVDTLGAETVLPMNDLMEIGIYAEGENGERGEPLYLRMHRIEPGSQRITVMVRKQPAWAGVDPRGLLLDIEPADNVTRN